MKKVFTLLTALFMAVSMFADTYSTTLEGKVWSEAGTQTLDGVNWTLATDGGYFGYDTSQYDKGQQIGSAKAAATYVTLSTTDIHGTITSVAVETAGASNVVATASVKVGNTAFGEAQTVTMEKQTLTFTGEAEGEIVISWTNESAKALYVKSITVNYTAPAAGWDGTVTTSLDGQTVTTLADFNNLKLTFPGASSVAVLGEEDCAYLALQNENGSELYGIWAPGYGSEYTIEGNAITLDGFMPMEGVTGTIPVGTTKLYVEDYGTLIIDGVDDYLPTLEFAANIAAAAEPFMLTSVTNNEVEGSVVGVEASEDGVSFQFTVTATGKELNAGEVLPTLSMMENDTDFGQASVIAYGGEQAYVRFMAPEKYYFTEPGTYVLNIPEGAFVDAEGTPNAAVAVKWVVIQNDAPASIAIEGIEPAVALENEFGDVYYQTALNVKVPESFIGKYYYSEGLFLEGSTSPFMFDFDEELGCGIVESTDLRIVFTDTRKNREPGTYTATASIFFIDEDWETELGTATFTGSLVLPALGEAPKATITLVNGEYTTELYDGAPVAEATSLTITMPKEYAEAVCTVDKLVYDEEYDYTYEETQYGSLEKVDATTWTFTFDKQPQNFASGFKYQIKVRGWEGGMFDEDWNLNPYDETLIVVNGVGAEDAVELDMSFYEYQINGEDENYELLYSDFDGVTLRYPWNNVEEVYGEEDFFQWGAIMLKVVNAYMYECDENLGYDVEHPYAEEHNAMSSEYDEVTIFSNVTVEPNKQYMIVIPQRGIRLINMMEYGFDDDTMDGVLWTNSGEWDEIYVLLNPKSVTTGISNVSNEDNAPMFNLAGQRVNGNVKGIVIKNGKKILVK